MFLILTVILTHPSSNLVNFDVEVYLLEYFTKGKSIILKVLPSRLEILFKRGSVRITAIIENNLAKTYHGNPP